jgi:hypothetical protein
MRNWLSQTIWCKEMLFGAKDAFCAKKCILLERKQGHLPVSEENLYLLGSPQHSHSHYLFYLN